MIEKVERCPLCNSQHYEENRNIYIDELIEMWVSKKNFNPIPKIYVDKVLQKRECNNCGLFYYNYHLADSEKLYESLEDVGVYYPNFRPTYEIARNIINEIKPQKLLEIGSGNGSFLEYIKDNVPLVLGNEYNAKAVQLCKKKELNVLSMPIDKVDEEFDVICHHEVLEHIFDIKLFLKNNIRLLKTGGKLIIGTPNPESILKINGHGELHYPPHHQFDFSKKTFEWLANEYNLKIYAYQPTAVEFRHYERYCSITGEKISYEECNKKYTGHSHVVVFEKK